MAETNFVFQHGFPVAWPGQPQGLITYASTCLDIKLFPFLTIPFSTDKMPIIKARTFRLPAGLIAYDARQSQAAFVVLNDTEATLFQCDKVVSVVLSVFGEARVTLGGLYDLK